jgi:epoxyqueuosine reductase QueG
MKRAGVRRFRRNLAVAIGNSNDPAAMAALVTHAGETCDDPMVREHVAWAMEKLGG